MYSQAAIAEFEGLNLLCRDATMRGYDAVRIHIRHPKATLMIFKLDAGCTKWRKRAKQGCPTVQFFINGFSYFKSG